MILLCNYIKIINKNIITFCVLIIILFNELYIYYSPERFQQENREIDKSLPNYEISIDNNVQCHIDKNKCMKDRQNKLIKDLYDETNWSSDEIKKTEYGKDIVCNQFTNKYICNKITDTNGGTICKFNETNGKCYNKNNYCIFPSKDIDIEKKPTDIMVKQECLPISSKCHIIDNKDECNKEVVINNNKCSNLNGKTPSVCECKQNGCIYDEKKKSIIEIHNDNDPNAPGCKPPIPTRIVTKTQIEKKCISYSEFANKINDDIESEYNKINTLN